MVTNVASYNFYNLAGNEALKEKAIQTLRTYGVGPCGPRGFYGTQDVHMKTEADIATHLGTSTCIVYAQAFSTISSVIPAFSKRGDIIVADKAVNFAIRKGMQISRSSIRWYEHNDMEDLQNVLASVVKEQARKPLTRRFIITEGLFENIGDMVNLAKVVGQSGIIEGTDAYERVIGRAKAPIQISAHPRRDMVLRSARADGGWNHGASRGQCAGGRHAGWFIGRPAVCWRGILCGIERDRGAPATFGVGVHILCRSACHAGDYSERSAFDARDERGDAGPGARKYQDDVGSIGSAKRMGALHKRH